MERLYQEREERPGPGGIEEEEGRSQELDVWTAVTL